MQEKDNGPGTLSAPGIKIEVKAEPDEDEIIVEMAIVPTFPCRLTVEVASRRSISLQELPPHRAFRLRDLLEEEDSIDLFISLASTEGDGQDAAAMYFRALLGNLVKRLLTLLGCICRNKITCFGRFQAQMCLEKTVFIPTIPTHQRQASFDQVSS